MDSINGINLNSIINSKATTANNNITKTDFKDFLLESLEKVNQDQIDANDMDQALALGEVDNIHEVMIASQKAELSLSFAVEVRNKITDAYSEIMKIQM